MYSERKRIDTDHKSKNSKNIIIINSEAQTIYNLAKEREFDMLKLFLFELTS